MITRKFTASHAQVAVPVQVGGIHAEGQSGLLLASGGPFGLPSRHPVSSPVIWLNLRFWIAVELFYYIEATA